jgi:hypothetical protein
MKRIIGPVLAASLLLGLGAVSLERRTNHPAGAAAAGQPQPSASSPAKVNSLPSHAYGLLKAVTEPLPSLQIMQRAVAAADLPGSAETPLMRLLGSPLTTAGLGPVRIGMSVEEATAAGIELIPLEPQSQGDCQALRLKDSLEPISFMVVQGRIIRIDVWQGSLLETKSGAKVGVSEADILKFYPDRIETVVSPSTGGKLLIFTPTGEGEDLYRLVFETDAGGQVVGFRSGQFPAVTWPRGCS